MKTSSILLAVIAALNFAGSYGNSCDSCKELLGTWKEYAKVVQDISNAQFGMPFNKIQTEVTAFCDRGLVLSGHRATGGGNREPLVEEPLVPELHSVQKHLCNTKGAFNFRKPRSESGVTRKEFKMELAQVVLTYEEDELGALCAAFGAPGNGCMCNEVEIEDLKRIKFNVPRDDRDEALGTALQALDTLCSDENQASRQLSKVRENDPTGALQTAMFMVEDWDTYSMVQRLKKAKELIASPPAQRFRASKAQGNSLLRKA